MLALAGSCDGHGAADVRPDPEPTVVPPRPVSPELARVSEFVLSRGACYGECPIDLMLVRPDGGVVYWGERHTARLGFHTGWLPRAQLGAIAEMVLAENGYTTLKSYYRSSWTDQATVITSVVVDGRRKVIEDYGHEAPEAAQTFVQALSLVLMAVAWDPDPIDAPDDSRGSPSCTELRRRVADTCLRFTAGEETSEMCRLFAGPAQATLSGSVPPELCAELARSFDLAPATAGAGPLEHGPVCSTYLASAASGCRDTLLGAPIADDTPTCRELVRALELLQPDDRLPEDDDLRQRRISGDKYYCESRAKR